MKLQAGNKDPKYAWSFPCTGPYKVLGPVAHTEGVYKIQMANGEARTVNVNRVELFNFRNTQGDCEPTPVCRVNVPKTLKK